MKRKATTSAEVVSSHFIELKEQFLLDIKAVVKIEDVPSDLLDHTGINIVPSSTWTQGNAVLATGDASSLYMNIHIAIVSLSY